jgi:hypothetical protein
MMNKKLAGEAILRLMAGSFPTPTIITPSGDISVNEG